ncbi:MAG TPA: hypothetical protein VMU77_02430 [Acidimicrobiales bacterium]|nr:hypothetical protein [Acidimicrobiales bacterium]
MRVQLAVGFAAIVIVASLLSALGGMALTPARTVTSMVTSTTTSISVETSTFTTYNESQLSSIQLELQNASSEITMSVYLANLTGPEYRIDGMIVNHNLFNVTLLQDNLCFVRPDGTSISCGGTTTNTQPIPPGGSYPLGSEYSMCFAVAPGAEPCTAGFISAGLLSVNYTATFQTPYGIVVKGSISMHVGSPST